MKAGQDAPRHALTEGPERRVEWRWGQPLQRELRKVPVPARRLSEFTAGELAPPSSRCRACGALLWQRARRQSRTETSCPAQGLRSAAGPRSLKKTGHLNYCCRPSLERRTILFEGCPLSPPRVKAVPSNPRVTMRISVAGAQQLCRESTDILGDLSQLFRNLVQTRTIKGPSRRAGPSRTSLTESFFAWRKTHGLGDEPAVTKGDSRF